MASPPLCRRAWDEALPPAPAAGLGTQRRWAQVSCGGGPLCALPGEGRPEGRAEPHTL